MRSLSCEGQCRSEFLIQHHIYQKGETVFRQGAVISGCYILCDGKVRLTRYTKRGSQYGVKFLGTSDFFGVPALFETKASPVEARALAESIVGWLSLRDFQELLRRYPSVAFELQKRLAREVGELYVRLAEQALLGPADD